MAKDIEDTLPPTNCFDNMVRYLAQLHPLGECVEAMKNRIVSACYPAKTVLLRPGQVANNLFFIEKGCLTSSELREGKVYYNWILTERCFTTATRSFFPQSVSCERIECLEPSTILSISYDDFYYLIENYHDFSVCIINLLSHITTLREIKFALANLPNAESRVRRMAMLNPQVFDRVPLNILANYLGMTPETLSRITHKKDFLPLLSQTNDLW